MKVVTSTDRSFKAAVKRITTRSNMSLATVEGSVKSILKAIEREAIEPSFDTSRNSIDSPSRPISFVSPLKKLKKPIIRSGKKRAMPYGMPRNGSRPFTSANA